MPFGRRGGFGGGFGMRRARPIFRPMPIIATAALTGAVMGSAACRSTQYETIVVQEAAPRYEEEKTININMSQPAAAPAPQPVMTTVPQQMYGNPTGPPPYYPQPVYNQYGQLVYPQYPSGQPMPYPPAQQALPGQVMPPGMTPAPHHQLPPQTVMLSPIPGVAPTAPPGYEFLDTDGMPSTQDLIQFDK